MLEVRNLNKSFGGLSVSRDISLKLEKGERRVILGPNGAGKTTLFNQLVGELAPSSGEIIFDDQNITKKTIEQRARLGLSRSYQKNNLFDDLTVRENLTLAASAATGRGMSFWKRSFEDEEVLQRVNETVEILAINSEVLDTPVCDASYGTRRQLEVGIALTMQPKLLLMDEPTSGVGPGTIKNFQGLLKNLPSELTVLMIEHDVNLAFEIADYITVLNYGEIVFEGTPDETRDSELVREIYLGTGLDD